jgi:hypothetical protein
MDLLRPVLMDLQIAFCCAAIVVRDAAVSYGSNLVAISIDFSLPSKPSALLYAI